MQLIRVLLVIVAIALLLSGISVFFGCSKQDKHKGARFFLATVGAAIWALAIRVFIAMPETSEAFAHGVVTCIIAGVTLCDLGLLAYLSWSYKGGKALTTLFTVIGIINIVLLAYDSSLFYTSIDMSQEYTHLFINKGWYYYSLLVYFFLVSITFSMYLSLRIKKTTHKGLKSGLKIFYSGLSISGILSLIFNLILISSHPHLTWIGPISTAITVLTFYYSIVKFRIIAMSSKWLEVMSYAVIIVTAIVVYLLAFYIVFTSLFGIPNPTNEVMLLNLIMGLFMILLMPTITELANFMRANYYVDRIELGYISRKLEGITREAYDPKDIARFLADTMHYSYIALLVNGRIYASDNSRFAAEETMKLAKLNRNEHGIHGECGAWIIPNEAEEAAFKSHDISRVGVLTNKNGKEIGKLIFGRRVSTGALSRKDLVKHEAIMGLLGCLVEDYSKK